MGTNEEVEEARERRNKTHEMEEQIQRKGMGVK